MNLMPVEEHNLVEEESFWHQRTTLRSIMTFKPYPSKKPTVPSNTANSHDEEVGVIAAGYLSQIPQGEDQGEYLPCSLMAISLQTAQKALLLGFRRRLNDRSYGHRNKTIEYQ
jgi:hypothetical protein